MSDEVSARFDALAAIAESLEEIEKARQAPTSAVLPRHSVPAFVSVAAAGRMMGLARSTVYAFLDREGGPLKTIRLTRPGLKRGRTMIEAESLIALIEASRYRADPAPEQAE